jgi:hypothetical protein
MVTPDFTHALTPLKLDRRTPAIARWRPMALSVLLLAAALLAPPVRAQADATVVEAVQLPAWVERQGQRRPA